jgi:hypothetical protein
MSNEEKLAAYSRARADAETEIKGDIEALARFLEKCMQDAERSEKEYKGKQDVSNKIMRTYYGAKKAALSEVLERLKWEFPFAFEEKNENG